MSSSAVESVADGEDSTESEKENEKGIAIPASRAFLSMTNN
jgi:hypothetical protein